MLARAAALRGQDWEYSLEASFIEVYNNTLRCARARARARTAAAGGAAALGGRSRRARAAWPAGEHRRAQQFAHARTPPPLRSDLLAEGAARSPEAGRIADANAIKHAPGGAGHTLVAGAARVPVRGAAHAAELVKRASEARSCAETAMNASSSRSHVVFMLYVKGRHAASGAALAGCLCLVDLAGSERLDRSLAEAERKKEACSINASLSALGDVFGALSAKSAHVPYRNSKLTYLLQVGAGARCVRRAPRGRVADKDPLLCIRAKLTGARARAHSTRCRAALPRRQRQDAHVCEHQP